MTAMPRKAEPIEATNFIEEAINEDIRAGKVPGHVHTRIPPEPNGYLHIGHAKNIWINYGIARRYGGLCNLRFDDTNPEKEEIEFVDAIQDDIRWVIGGQWDSLHFASDYYEQTYQFAEKLIMDGKAYVDDLSAEQIREYRGTLTEPGRNSPYRDRPIEENLDLFRRMRAGEFAEGSRVLRAIIDMASPNMNMRDPVLYRIRYATHQLTGDTWCIYPMYDFSHPIGDALEHITHSMCSLEYEDHRPLYDWVVDACGFTHKPRQIEYARLSMTGTIMSKRYLRRLVEDGYVNGWDDPRMPTIRGLRRRGYTPAAIKDFVQRAGVAKADSVVDVALLEHCIREELNQSAPRAMAVLDPVKLVITDYPAGKTETFTLENHPGDPAMGTREVAFSGELYIEREDFMLNPPKKYFRLKPGGEVRLKGAYIVRCQDVLTDEQGNIIQINCTHDPDSYSGGPTADRRIKGTIHWVDAATSVPAEVRLYDLLLNDRQGGGEQDDYLDRFNPDSLQVLPNARVEAALARPQPQVRYQFMRQGYFCLDPDTTPELPVFNRIVGLKDSFAKAMRAGAAL